jgi:hypothetical protein
MGHLVSCCPSLSRVKRGVGIQPSCLEAFPSRPPVDVIRDFGPNDFQTESVPVSVRSLGRAFALNAESHFLNEA